MGTRTKKELHAYLRRVRIYDDPKYVDRYTVVFMDLPEKDPNTFACVSMSKEPFHPQGFGQHSTAMPGSHLGARIDFRDLPRDCQKLVLQDIEDILNNGGGQK
jgi:hypothetical protein